MGGTVIETESDKIKIQLIVELRQVDKLDDSAILTRLQEKIRVSLERAKTYLTECGNKLICN